MSGSIRISLLGSLASGSANLSLLPLKARALLGYLATHSGVPVSRERLADLLWARSGPEQARQSLRQALASLRQQAPADLTDVLVATGEHVTFDVETDVRRVEALAAASETEAWQEALSFWRGTFLEGITTRAEGFDDWANQERRRLTALRADLLARLGNRLLTDGDREGAIAQARSLVELEPLREDGHRLLIAALAATGRRAEALAQYERLALLLRTELGVVPDPATKKVVDELRIAAGQTSVGSAVVSKKVDAPVVAADASKATAQTLLTMTPLAVAPVVAVSGPAKTGVRPWHLATAAMALAAAVIGGFWALRSQDTSLPSQLPTLIVKPFEALTPDLETAQLARALSTRLSGGLSGIPIVQVRSADASHSDLRIEGSVASMEGGRAVVAARLVRASGEVLGQREFRAPQRTPSDMQDEILGAVGDSLVTRLHEFVFEKSAVTNGQIKARTLAAEAQDRVGRGETDDIISQLLEQALRLDPTNIAIKAQYGRSLVAIATNSGIDRAKRNEKLRRSLQILDEVADVAPHHYLMLSGRCGALRSLQNSAAARVACERVRAVRPWSAYAYTQLGYVMLQLGIPDEAEQYFLASHRLEAQSTSRWTSALGAGFAALLKDDPQAATNWFGLAEALRPGSTWYPLLSAVAAHRRGDLDAERAALRRFDEKQSIRQNSLDNYFHFFFPSQSLYGPEVKVRIDRLKADMAMLMEKAKQ